MKDLSKIILPLGFVALIGACAPYPPYPGEQSQNPTKPSPDAEQQTATDEQQRQIAENRRRLEEQEAKKQEESLPTTPVKPPTSKPKYPTATQVPGKDGFVFNPYTQNIVNVKGIASGKLVRDPEDGNPDNKFRVP